MRQWDRAAAESLPARVRGEGTVAGGEEVGLWDAVRFGEDQHLALGHPGRGGDQIHVVLAGQRDDPVPRVEQRLEQL